MALWFVVLAVLGAGPHRRQPGGAAGAVARTTRCVFLLGHPGVAFVALGSVVLCVTGAEALYADMGHFGKRPIRLAWFALAMPALRAQLLRPGRDAARATRRRSSNPFYEMAPAWALYPLIALATCATVIASQALITAAFSVTKQAIQLGYLPRLRILHTSVRETGQIYVPFVNWGCTAASWSRSSLFGSSSELAGAYGIAVTIDMLITTTMTFFVDPLRLEVPVVAVRRGDRLLLRRRRRPSSPPTSSRCSTAAGSRCCIGAVMFTLMMTWKQGRQLMSERLRDDAIDLEELPRGGVRQPADARARHGGVPGQRPGPHAERAAAQPQAQQGAARDATCSSPCSTTRCRGSASSERCEMEPLGHDCWQVTLHFGFKNEPDVPEALSAAARAAAASLDDMDTSYFLSRDIVIPTLGGGMATGARSCSPACTATPPAAADFLSLPTNRVVELGSKVEI